MPPWSLFADTEGKEGLIEKIESVEDHLPIYYINLDEEIKVSHQQMIE